MAAAGRVTSVQEPIDYLTPRLPPGLARPRRKMLWHANYHPDGGQLFFPLERRPFYVPLALPGDDVTPQKFVCFRFSGQGAVHARVSVDFAREFGCLFEAAIPSAP